MYAIVKLNFVAKHVIRRFFLIVINLLLLYLLCVSYSRLGIVLDLLEARRYPLYLRLLTGGVTASVIVKLAKIYLKAVGNKEGCKLC